MKKENYTRRDFYYLPILRVMQESGDKVLVSDIIDKVIEICNITENQLSEKTKNGQHDLVDNRIRFALLALKNIGYISSAETNYRELTDKGRQAPLSKQLEYDLIFQMKEWNKRYRKYKKHETLSSDSETEDDEKDLISRGFDEQIVSELQGRIKNIKPIQFEDFCSKLMSGMKGSIYNARTTQASGDGGYDIQAEMEIGGVIRVPICAQCKHTDSVGPEKIQAFSGAMSQNKFQYGIFITSGRFTKKAEEAAKVYDRFIRLIDGNELIELLIEHRIGVSPREILEVDEAFFKEWENTD